MIFWHISKEECIIAVDLQLWLKCLWNLIKLFKIIYNIRDISAFNLILSSFYTFLIRKVMKLKQCCIHLSRVWIFTKFWKNNEKEINLFYYMSNINRIEELPRILAILWFVAEFTKLELQNILIISFPSEQNLHTLNFGLRSALPLITYFRER